MLTVQDVLAAQRRIQPFLLRTPVRHSFLLSERTGAAVLLKQENRQLTGSFKPRGALNLMALLDGEERARGIVTASAGNHALGVGLAARILGIAPVTIFVPRNAPVAKLDKLREFPVEVRPVGDSYSDAHHAAQAFQTTTGATFVNAYDDPRTVAGQGTIGLELVQDLPDLDAILVPVGGGGLIAGIAIAVKALAPRIQVIGVQPEASPALVDSLRDGVCYEDYAAGPTICDGLAGGVGRICFDVARARQYHAVALESPERAVLANPAVKLIDGVVVVAEDEVKAAVRALLETEQLVVEGSGAVGVAALLAHRVDLAGRRVAAVLSGGNIDLPVLEEIIHKKP